MHPTGFSVLYSRALLMGLGSLAVVGCADEVGLTRATLSVEVDPIVDFGTVPVGSTVERTLVVRNSGDGPIAFDVVADGVELRTTEYRFEVTPTQASLPRGESAMLTVSYQALAEGPVDVPIQVVTNIVDPDDPSGFVRRQVRLQAVAVGGALRVEPNPVTFGSVLLGTTKTIPLTITNLLAQPVPLLGDGVSGTPNLITSGSGTFTVAAVVSEDGSLLGPGQQLPPNGSITFQATYQPSIAGDQDRATWTVAHCEEERCQVTVRFGGAGADAAVVCEPAAVDFGATNPGTSRTRMVTCENVASDPVTITGWSTSFPFSVRAGNVPFELAGGAQFDIEVAFAPALADLDQTLRGRLQVDVRVDQVDLAPVEVALEGSVGGPRLVVLPSSLNFGTVAVGTEKTKRVVLSNFGYDPAIISDVEVDQAGTGMYSTDFGPQILAEGDSTTIEVTFSPSAPGAHPSALVITSNGGADALIVPLAGIVENLPPCQYVLQPARVQFGSVRIGERPVRDVVFDNVGPSECLVNDVEIIAQAGTATSAFRLENPPPTDLRIMPGATHTFSVSFGASSQTIERAVLTMYVSSPAASAPEIELSGIGQPQVDAVCPGPQTVVAGNPLVLTVTGQAVGSLITGYSWRVVPGQAPPGGANTPGLWTPNPPNAPTITFRPFLVGRYELEATVTNDLNQQASCTVPVDVTGQGLIVTLTWNGSGDVDLHLHSGLTSSPWFNMVNDCHYASRTPVWNTAFPRGTGPNPELDFDNTSGNGPENISIDQPEIGRRYAIGIHNYAAAAGRTATVTVFCGGVSAPTRTFTSRPLNGTSFGDCSPNDFWKVATIEFTSASACTIVPIDTYGPSSAACTAF